MRRTLFAVLALAATLTTVLFTASVAAAQAPAELENVLVFSKTAGFRHTEGIAAGHDAIDALGAANDFDVVHSEDSAQFTDANLAQFDAVIFLSTTGDVLNDEQQAAFERYIQSGGGFVGIHAAADTEYEWDWYGDMLGGYFRNHPDGTPQATVNRADDDEPSTAPVPATWTRTDEWYNYQGPLNPQVGGGGADYDLRVSDVKVLLTVDEGSYGEADGNDPTADYHAIAWCSNFDGGRMWYTGMGHTGASFGETDFREHLLGGIQTAAGSVEADCGQERIPQPQPEDFEKVTLDDDTDNPFELDVAPDGRVFYIERDGRLMIIHPEGDVVQAGAIAVNQSHENGLMGLQLAPDFETSQWVYLGYSLPDGGGRTETQVVARYKMNGDQLDMASRQEIFSWQAQRAVCCHSAVSLYFDPQGNLYISTGDNTNPFRSGGYTPIDERTGEVQNDEESGRFDGVPFRYFDAQRTSANSNDYNGKILRIRPNPDTPGYTVPDGNMFGPNGRYPAVEGQTRPEIYAMGFRNPFRFTIDPATGWVLMGDYGPDAGAGNQQRGPQGSVEFNTVTEPGFYGWPYCVRDNTPYRDWVYNGTNMASGGTARELFNCADPVNDSPNNTGIDDLPPAIGADAWMGYTDQDPRFGPDLGGGGAPTGGPRYHYNPDGPDSQFPEYYDGLWFNGEWNQGWIKTFGLDANGSVTEVNPFPFLGAPGCTHDADRPTSCYKRPMDMDFGPDGSLYLIEWGTLFGGSNPDSAIYRIDYVVSGRRPIARASANPSSGQPPLTVQFSSAGSEDPDETPITYAWDFEGDGTVDSTLANPTFEYDEPGDYRAVLRVTDQSGAVGSDSVRVVVGNDAPVVDLVFPESGMFAGNGERVPYKITVVDAQDGSTEAGTISCDDVKLNVALGHDTHSHTLQTLSGCEGTFSPAGEAGHDASANTFPAVEAFYVDKGGAGGAVPPLTGRDLVGLQPRRKQAEFFSNTGRTADGRGGGAAGAQREATTDPGGFQNIGNIEDGDWVSYTPMNLKDITGLRFRVASGGPGANIQVRLDAPDGELVAETGLIEPTGNWQTWKSVDLTLPQPVPSGPHELFFVFRHPTDTGGLMNLNWIQAIGKGAANTAAPNVTVAASPTSGEAPLTVAFDGEATDPEGEALTYQWDFGVSGTSDDQANTLDASYTYQRAGTYNASLTVTDASGGRTIETVQVRVTAPPSQCPQNNLSDEFEGGSIDPKWQFIRPDNTRPPTVEDGYLRFPIDNGSLYLTGTSARNIMVQPLPEGQVEITAQIETEPLTQDYQQAGLRVYAGDEDWASVHMISAGGVRDIEFIYENDNVPRNGPSDKLGGVPPGTGNQYWVRLISDGETLTAQYSFDGTTFNDVGQPADISDWVDPKVGPVALSDQAPAHPVASFDWIRFEPDGGGGGGGGGTTVTDEFEGTQLATPPWGLVRGDQTVQVTGGGLVIPAAQGDLYQGTNTATNLVLQQAPTGPWTAQTKVNFEGTAQYHQAGLIVYGTDDNYAKLGRIAHTETGDEKFEFISETAGTARNGPNDDTDNLRVDFPDDYWLRLVSDGTNLTASYSEDGAEWTPVGQPAPIPANARIGLFAFNNAATTSPSARFEFFSLTTGTGGGGPSGPSRDDQFDGEELDETRWNAIVRENDEMYDVAGGELTITTEPGDIFGSNDTNPNNFILQSADHAGADWTIETKLSGTINGGWAQGGLIAYVDDDDYVKFDAISDDNHPEARINRIELRSETNDVVGNPQPQVDVPAGTTDIWLRLKKTGTSYAGEFSYDGATWTPMSEPVTNAMAAPAFGLFAFGPLPAGQNDQMSFDYFLLDGADSGECECQPGEGDEFDGTTLDKTRWNGIVREDDTKYALEGGQLRVTTVAGDFYEDQPPATTANLFLQTADHADDDDWTIETHVGVDEIAGGYEQGGLIAYVDDDNYVKLDPVSNPGTTGVNRIELRSEVDSVIQPGAPADITIPESTTDVWLRLTKTGTNYGGQYSLDGENWTSFATTVPNPMEDPRFGVFTLGPQMSGHVVTFEYFEVDGERGCDGPEPPNRAPVIDEVAATPTSGFAPLEVDFTSAATDPEGSELTFSWDFDGDGEEDADTANATFTYTEPGDYAAELTVSDGERSVSDTVLVNVLEEPDEEARFSVLVFSKTAGFRHDSIDEGHAAIEALGEENNFHVDHSEDASVFRDAILNRYDAVVFLSTTGDVLNASQQRAFERYIQAGNGYAGIHAAADTEYDWNWYGHLVGGYFLSHPPGTPDATVHVEDRDHHSTEGIPTPWERTDEWYNYRSPDYQDPDVPDGDYSPREGGVHVLMTVDETTYDEGDGNDPVADDHPISWCQTYDGGRSWYTGMGHTAATYAEPEYLLHLLGGIETAAGMPSTECDAPNRAPSVQAAADPDTGRAPLTVRFSAAGSDPDGDSLTYLWEFADGQRSFRQNPTHVYNAPGTYDAKVTVTDGDGASGTATVRVVVTDPPGNVAPTVVAAADPARGRPPLRVRFSAAGTDADGDPLTYRWDFDDDAVAYGAQVTHRYEERGTYDAVVTVTDSKGATGTATVRVRVTRNGAVLGESAAQPGLRVASSYRAARVVEGGLRFRVSCEAFCRVTSTLRMRGGDEERLGASNARRIGAGKSRAIVLKLDRRVRRNLLDAMGAADMSRVRATLVVRVTSADGATTLRREVALTR